MTANFATNYLDLDDVAPIADFTIKLNGVEHKVVETTIEDFILTVREVEELGMKPNLENELNTTLKQIRRAIPTASEQELRRLKFSQLKKIQEFVQTVNGEKTEKVEDAPVGEGAQGNAEAAK